MQEMRQSPTANQIRGRARGSLFFAGFGALWILGAIYIKGMVTPVNVALVSADLAVLLVTIVWLFRRSRFFVKMPDDPAQSKAFNRVNLIQWVAIFVVSYIFNRLHWEDFAVGAMTAIVGLHLFPLARVFRYPLHYATGAALVGWAVVSSVFVPRGQIQGTTALGTGILLWVSSWITLFLVVQSARRGRRSA